MGLRNTETVLSELIARIDQCMGQDQTSSYEYLVISALEDYLGFVRDLPRGESFDAEVVRMARTVEAFLGEG